MRQRIPSSPWAPAVLLIAGGLVGGTVVPRPHPAGPGERVFHRTASVEGLKVFYREAGPPRAPAIVLLHGFPSSSHMYRDLIPRLARRFHVVAPDYPGFGNSDAPSPEVFRYTFDALARVMEGFLESLPLRRFALYVHDYGAPVGFRIAARHPDWIEALVIQNANAYAEGLSPATAPLQEYWKDRSEAKEAPLRQLLGRDGTIFQYTEGTKDPARLSPDAWNMDQYFLDRPGNDRIQLDLLFDYQTNLGRYEEWHQYFRTRQPPALVVWGRNDPFFTPEGALAYKRDLKDARIHLLETGHFALEEEHETIAQLIEEFLAR